MRQISVNYVFFFYTNYILRISCKKYFGILITIESEQTGKVTSHGL